jgi:hypothetical protein
MGETCRGSHYSLRELDESAGNGRLSTSRLSCEEKVARSIGVGEPIVDGLEDPLAPCEVLGSLSNVAGKINDWPSDVLFQLASSGSISGLTTVVRDAFPHPFRKVPTCLNAS